MSAGPSDDDSTRPADPSVPAGEGVTTVLAFWDGGYRRLPLIDTATVDIGRAEECELRIDHPSVSRHHLRLYVSSELEIEDLGSFNGSRLNGVPLPAQQRCSIGAGDVVELGTAWLIVQPRTLARSERSLASDAGRQAMQRLERLIDLVGRSRINVLIVGETGSGKEVAAEAIHARCGSDKSFVSMNCAAVPEHLLEAELFGFERGAFTGADRAKPGLLEAANGGTFFLDEIGELPLTTQAKLLRVIERREVQRLGALVPQRIDVRFIAATHRDLAALVEQKRFRSDLMYRINGITIAIPPLRDRVFQIDELARGFARAAAAELGQPEPTISPEAMGALGRYDWPGNIRELKNTVERAVLLSEGAPVRVEHVQLGIPLPSRPPPGALGRNALRRDYAEFERERILSALEQAGGNQTEAAKQLGISRRTLMNRLDALDMPRPRKRPR